MNICGQDCQTRYCREEVLLQYFLILSGGLGGAQGVHAHGHTLARCHTLTGFGFPAHVVVVFHSGRGVVVMVNWRTNDWVSPKVRTSPSHVICVSCLEGRGWGAAEKKISPFGASSSFSTSPSTYFVTEKDGKRIYLAINHEILTPHLSVMWSHFGCAALYKVRVCLGRLSVHMANHVNEAASRHTFVFTARRFSPQFYVDFVSP